MRFGWDENKNSENIGKHRIDFADASPMFDRPMPVEHDRREDYGEDRWRGIGFLRNIIAVMGGSGFYRAGRRYNLDHLS